MPILPNDLKSLCQGHSATHSTFATSTQIMLFVEILKILKKMHFFKEKLFVKENKFGIFKISTWNLQKIK
jgi:hypothetical protein